MDFVMVGLVPTIHAEEQAPASVAKSSACQYVGVCEWNGVDPLDKPEDDGIAL